jgi:hypothetical protein
MRTAGERQHNALTVATTCRDGHSCSSYNLGDHVDVVLSFFSSNLKQSQL